MRIVLFSRVPRWYSFKGDRCVGRLAREGHQIAGVVVEQMPTLSALREWLEKLGPRVLAEKAAWKLLTRLALGQKGPSKSVLDSAPGSNAVRPPVYVVDSHNSPGCVEMVRTMNPDVIVLRGCGIIKKPILEVPRVGTLNAHYGLLPTYRGRDVTEWAVLHGGPIGVTVHFVSEGVDVGAVLASRLVSVERGDTLGRLREKSAALAVELFVEVLAQLEAGSSRPVPQDTNQGRQYFAMHPRLKKLANERLKRIGR